MAQTAARDGMPLPPTPLRQRRVPPVVFLSP